MSSLYTYGDKPLVLNDKLLTVGNNSPWSERYVEFYDPSATAEFPAMLLGYAVNFVYPVMPFSEGQLYLYNQGQWEDSYSSGSGFLGMNIQTGQFAIESRNTDPTKICMRCQGVNSWSVTASGSMSRAQLQNDNSYLSLPGQPAIMRGRLIDLFDYSADTMGIQYRSCYAMFAPTAATDMLGGIDVQLSFKGIDEVGAQAFRQMFYRNTNMTTLPKLYFTNFSSLCCNGMFAYCPQIKISETQSEEYPYPYRIPWEGIGQGEADALNGMFAGTGGTFTGTPELNKTYYTSNKIID